jgi:hypothetical protein
MGFSIIDTPQRSEAWFAARCGRLTASCAKEMLATIKTGEAAARRDLRTRLVVERLTGQPQDDGYVNDVMRRGTELEPDALAAYEALTGNLASSVGFLAHVDLFAGGSPDGVIGDFEGLVELKCPKSATHFGYLRGDAAVPPEHLAQLTHLLWLTGCPWIDFLSYDPRFPKKLQTFYVRLERDEKAIEEYDAKVRAFLDEVDREVSAAQGWDVLLKETA